MADPEGPEREMKVMKRCGFYVQRKRRHCRMIPAKGNALCAEHLCFQDHNLTVDQIQGTVAIKEPAITDTKRVPCPLDPKHSIFENRLSKHLLKCNSRHKKQQDFYEEKINSGLKDHEIRKFEKVRINEVSKAEILKLIEKVNGFYSKSNLCVKESFKAHEVLKEELSNKEYGNKTKKHLLQQASIINIIEENHAFKDNVAFLEFGAGKGKLSHWLQKAVGDRSGVDYVLVDRQNHRNKYDCYHKGDDQGPSFKRLNVDIEHLNLDKVADLNDKGIVGIGKHLCGGATDLALRCLLERGTKDALLDARSKKPRIEPGQKNVELIVLALCCYHRCTWPSFVGREFLHENGFNEEDFQLMTQICSWAVCGHRPPEKDGTRADKDEVIPVAQPECRNLPLIGEEKKEVGLKCKRIIDLGRCNYLQRLGFRTELLRYVDSTVTLENVALLAKPQVDL